MRYMKLSLQNCGKILYELTKDAAAEELDKIIKQFILFLSQKRMVTKIKYIMDEFVNYTKEKNGIVKLKIMSAKELSKSEVNKICRYFGDKVETEIKIDATLLGGVVIKDKNRILDASLKTQLQKFKKQLS